MYSPIRKALLVWLPVLAAGCAAVNPRPDYERAGEYITQATGHDNVQPADNRDEIEQRVEDLLDNGLTVREAIEVCLINNPEFRARWSDVGMARADLVQAGLLSNPTLGLSTRLPSGGGLSNVEASIAQNIADVWQIPARRRGAEHALNQAILALARQASVLASETRAAYYRAVGTGQSNEIALENARIADQFLDTAIVRREAGAGSELDVNLARSAALEAQLLCETQRLEHAEAVRDLARFLGLSLEADQLTLNDEIPPPPSIPLNSENMVVTAREHRLDIQAAREAVADTAARINLEEARFLPSVEVGVAMERGERPPGEPRNGSNVIVGPAFGVELPVFDQNQAQIARARFAHEQAAHMLDAIDRQMTQDVRGAVDQARTASKLVRLAQEQFVPLAQKNLDLSTESYRAGKTSVLSVLEAQRFLLDSRRRHVLARIDAATALAEVERVVGLPLDRIAQASATAPPAEQKQTPDGDRP